METLASAPVAADSALTAEQSKLVETHIRLAAHKANQAAKLTGMPVDDLLQSALLGLCRAAKKFNPALGCEFSTFGGQAAWNAAVDEAKRIIRWRRHTFSLDPLEANLLPDRETIVPDSWDKEALVKAIDLLNRKAPQSAAIVRMLYFQGMSVPDIAAMRGTSKQVVYQQRNSALRYLGKICNPSDSRPIPFESETKTPRGACQDCGRAITMTRGRCKACVVKARFAAKNGNPLPETVPPSCVDCGKTISCMGTRCRSCSGKRKRK